MLIVQRMYRKLLFGSLCLTIATPAGGKVVGIVGVLWGSVVMVALLLLGSCLLTSANVEWSQSKAEVGLQVLLAILFGVTIGISVWFLCFFPEYREMAGICLFVLLGVAIWADNAMQLRPVGR